VRTLRIIEKNKKVKSCRSWIATKLVRLAQWIEPDNDAVNAFVIALIIDQMIYGQSIVRIDPVEEEQKVKKAYQGPTWTLS
jgi:hypothetical protein